MTVRGGIHALTPERAVELFILANLAFLGADIAIAHLANEFAVAAEWAPLVFSAGAVPLLLVRVLGIASKAIARWLNLVVACGAIVLGVAGMLYHLASGFFATPNLHNLVYSAPFAAPLAYVGVGLLAILLHTEPLGSAAFGPWVLTLSLGGVLGNFVISVLDHAQNGFFNTTEWIPVAAAALVAGFLLLAVLRPERAFLRLCLVVCAAEGLVGVLGFALHLHAPQPATAGVLDRLVYGPPLFAPLLFTNIAVLSSLGLWACLRSTSQATAPT